MISWLTEVELSSALAKKVRQDELSEQDARRVEELFRDHCDADLYQLASLRHADYIQARK